MPEKNQIIPWHSIVMVFGKLQCWPFFSNITTLASHSIHSQSTWADCYVGV